MMQKQEIYDFLKNKGIWYEAVEHEAVYNMEELAQISLPYPEADAKNLFVRNDKKSVYYLITVKNDKKINLKAFQKQYGTRRLSFASADDLQAVLGLFPGAVSPFGLLNEASCQTVFYLDEEFLTKPGIIGIHPNENTATVFLKTEDLVDIIQEHGNPICSFSASGLV